MTRHDVRRILSELAGVDPEQDAGIEVQLHARTPGPRGTHTVTTVRMVDLTHALADLLERQSKEAVHRAQEWAHRAEIKVTELQLAAVKKEREMSEANVAAAEHPGNTVMKPSEPVSLHERLREADKDREAGKSGVRYPFWATSEQLAAIEAAIRADATAPLRERIEELELYKATYAKELSACGATIAQLRTEVEQEREQKNMRHAAWLEVTAQHEALRARANELRDAVVHALDAYYVGEFAAQALDSAIATYDGVEKRNTVTDEQIRNIGIEVFRRNREASVADDAADRAGETQDGMDSGGADADRGTADRSDGDGQGLVPSPTVTLEVPEGTKEAALAFLADKKKDTIAEVVADALKPGDQTADRVIHVIRSINGGATAVPPDINWHGEFGIVTDRDGKTSSWVKSDTHPHLNYDTRTTAPSPTDAAAGDEAPWEDSYSAEGVWSRLSRAEDQVADIERWRTEGDERVHQLTVRADSTKRSLDTFAKSINNTRKDVHDLERWRGGVDDEFPLFRQRDQWAELAIQKWSDRIAALESQLDFLRSKLESVAKSQEDADRRLLPDPRSANREAGDLEKKYAEHDTSWTPDGMQTQIDELRDRLDDLEGAEQQRVTHNITAAGMANLVLWINDRLDEMNDGALEARQGGVPEVVTLEVIEAYWTGSGCEGKPKHMQIPAIRAGLAAAIAVMGTGGGR